MPTLEHLITGLVHQFNALRLPTDIAEGRLHRGWSTLHLLIAESAFFSLLELLELLARLSQVVGLSCAVATEVLVAGAASHSELAHVHRRLSRNAMALIILLVIIYLTLHQLHHIPTVALNQVRVSLQDVHLHNLLHLIQILGVQHRLYLIVMDHLLALRAGHSLRFLHHLKD